jgi:hypothetical protein
MPLVLVLPLGHRHTPRTTLPGRSHCSLHTLGVFWAADKIFLESDVVNPHTQPPSPHENSNAVSSVVVMAPYT